MAGGIKNLLHQGFPVLAFGENVPGDFNKVAVKIPFVPFSEHLVHLVMIHAQPVLHETVGLADELHVAILNAIMDHLDIMACTIVADPVAAG